MDAVGDLDRRLVEGGLARGARAEDVAEERPVGLGLDRRVDAEEAAARLEITLERGLLGVVEHVA